MQQMEQLRLSRGGSAQELLWGLPLDVVSVEEEVGGGWWW
jgi:hypothetical protein